MVVLNSLIAVFSPIFPTLVVVVLALMLLGMAVLALMPFQMIGVSNTHPLGMVAPALMLLGLPGGSGFDADLGAGFGLNGCLNNPGFD
jgi:hypothetical protein